MTIKKIDLWLRSVWTLWDSHGTRILNVLSVVYTAASAIIVWKTKASPETSAMLLALGSAFGFVGRARGQNNADIKAGKTIDPTDQAGV